MVPLTEHSDLHIISSHHRTFVHKIIPFKDICNEMINFSLNIMPLFTTVIFPTISSSKSKSLQAPTDGGSSVEQEKKGGEKDIQITKVNLQRPYVL